MSCHFIRSHLFTFVFIGRVLDPQCVTSREQSLCLKMKQDDYHSLVEVAAGDDKKGIVDQ